MVLVRHHLGDVLRRQRMRQGRTLRQVSADARVSLGYLSEIERGQKEASSELLSSICAALDVALSDVLQQVSEELAVLETAERAAAAAAVGPRPVTVTSERIDARRLDNGRRPSAPVASAA